MSGWVVTGTDTGVGKTVLSAALCRVRLDIGARVRYVKPIQSGAADGDDDAADVAALTGVETVVGATLGPSLAPGVALRLAGEALPRDELVAPVRQALASGEVVVEGAGGLLVELTADGATIADIAAELDLPLLVAVRPGLGTLNHTALTLEAAERRGLPVMGVVIVGYPPRPDAATASNVAQLDRIAGGRLVGIIPWRQPRLDVDAAAGWLAPVLGGTWDRQDALGGS